MRHSFVVVLAVVLGVVTLPAVAGAAPGSAAVDQYRENIPADAAGKGDGANRKLPAGARRALEETGADGEDLARALDGAAGGTGSGEEQGDASGTGVDSGTAGDRGVTAAGRRADGSAEGDGGEGPGTGGTARSSADEDPSGDTAGSAVSAGVGAEIGPVPLWAALVAVLLGSVGVAVVRRGRS